MSKLAALALGALGVACVSMAGLSYSGRTSLLGNQLMVVDIPMGQGLLVGKECEKACEDNFLKCTHNAGLTSPKEGEVYSGYKYFQYNPTKSDKESVWRRDIKHCWYTYEEQCSNRCDFPY